MEGLDTYTKFRPKIYSDQNINSAYVEFKKFSVEDDWSLPQYHGVTTILHLRYIQHLLNRTNLVEDILFSDIAWKGFSLKKDKLYENCFCCGGGRYDKANTKYPPILIMGSNNYNKQYRLIDGKHRIMKLIKQEKVNKGSFYVLQFEQIKPFLVEIK